MLTRSGGTATRRGKLGQLHFGSVINGRRVFKIGHPTFMYGC
jgi:hypothetical protein